ncbi:hypothetical protein DT603_14525 [Pseudoxanthomonas gei]|uniref:Outer membrane protein beta-barrel domain-containing protein n=1 Tax=Pseudoxanthomonas gei TaxID=1383030 RepID=A0ABX0AF53_9GAMM|nr:hypothetical protein [Pseudoxanthomonas gei]NDK40056.1 hypothetical protein [Pseudoxanthomonas gei]
MHKHLPLSLALAAPGLFAASSAHAIEDDGFHLRLGAISAEGNSDIRGSTVFNGEEFDFSEGFDYGSAELSPRVEGQFRLSNRNRLLFNYFSYEKDQSATLGNDLSYDDVTLPAGSFAKIDSKFELASLVYDFAVVETDTISLGLQVGAEYAKVESTLSAGAGELDYSTSSREDGFAPVVGARFTAAPGEKWRVVVQAQYLDADWGDLGKYEGDLTRANALVEYRITPKFGVFAGYDWFKLDVEQTGGEGVVGLDQRFKGPMAGVTLSF